MEIDIKAFRYLLGLSDDLWTKRNGVFTLVNSDRPLRIVELRGGSPILRRLRQRFLGWVI